MPKRSIVTRLDDSIDRLQDDKIDLSFSSRLFLCGGPIRRPPPDVLSFRVERGPFYYELVADHRYGLPWGVYGRLIQIWIDTQIVRSSENNRSSALEHVEIENSDSVFKGQLKLSLGSSLSRWLSDIGLNNDGRTMRAVVDNWMRLASIKIACGPTSVASTYTLSPEFLGFFSGIGHDAFPLCVYSSFWWSRREMEQLHRGAAVDCFIVLNPLYVEFIQRFRAIPLRDDVLSLLHESALGIDFYRWLAHRHHAGRPFAIDLNSLLTEFGIHTSDPNSYKRALESYLDRIKTIWKIPAKFADGNRRKLPARFLYGV